ncbi:MAG TPA: LysR substrate-binding domain-containing protein [Polyangia bacterium]|nr:LysR substrate-binding domain-containing protein [Polyangia bacterium]
MDLNALQDFVLVATHGGFARASRARRIPKSSLSRRVRELEEKLGVRLLDRTARTFRLTAEGGELFHAAGPTLSEIDDVEQSLQSKGGGEPTGRLRIAAPTLFGNLFLGRLAARYYATYPKVELEIVVGDRAFDLLADGFEAAIRVNAPDTSDLVRRRFATCRMQLVAAPGFAAKFGKLSAGKCEALPTILFENGPVAPPWRFSNGRRAFEVVPRATLRLSTLAMVREAALEGAGFAMLPDTIVAGDLADGTLRHFGDLEGVDVDLSIVHPSRRLVSRRLRAFIDMVVAIFPDGRKPDLRSLSARA